MKNNSTRRTVLAAMFAALIFLGTFIIKIPITATNGYIHFGDGFIYIAASILPLPFAAAAAAVGGFLADMLAGYMAYAPWTAVIKALMGTVIALMLRNNTFMRRVSGQKIEGDTFSRGLGLSVLATVVAGIINVGGYFPGGVLYVFTCRGARRGSDELPAIRFWHSSFLYPGSAVLTRAAYDREITQINRVCPVERQPIVRIYPTLSNKYEEPQSADLEE